MAVPKDAGSSLKIVERVLFVAVVFLGGYLIYSLEVSKNNTQKISVGISFEEPKPVLNAGPAPIKELNAFSDYRDRIQERNIFAVPVVPDAPGTPAGAAAEIFQGPLTELPSHFKIVGLILGKLPEVAIEDTKGGQTYFIPEGQTRGELTFTGSEQDRIFIQYNGQNIAIPIRTTHAQTP